MHPADIVQAHPRDPNPFTTSASAVPTTRGIDAGSGTRAADNGELALERRLSRLGLSGRDDWADRYLLCEHVLAPPEALDRQRFEAVARFIRDLVAHRWVRTRQVHRQANPKRAYYVSMEFLPGRMLHNNILNLAAEPLVDRALQHEGWILSDLMEQEPDAGLGNGGLGRLAACFIDSLASLQYPAMGYGLRYEYGMFRQVIRDGHQVEEPDNWLRRPDPWQVPRPGKRYAVPFHATFDPTGGTRRRPSQPWLLSGVAHDCPVIGYGARCVNTLRLWAATTPQTFNFADFSSGDIVGAVLDTVAAESLTRVLYPDDSTEVGRDLRFLQEYFLVSCSLQDILARFTKANGPQWKALPEHVAIQLNDTHPALAVSELMRLLIDREGVCWQDAWDVTVRTLAYTNHTLLPEALETWPVGLFEQFLPRQLEIIYDINGRFLDAVAIRYPHEPERRQRMSLIQETPARAVRMAHLAVVGSHSTNGVSDIHSALLRSNVLTDFADMFPERFNNKTNGVSQRRWLLHANPSLATLITEAIGDEWVSDFGRIRDLARVANDPVFHTSFRAARQLAKERFTSWLRRTTGYIVDPESLFDVQIKRIHEYKRQLLNVLAIVTRYNRLRQGLDRDAPARTYIFSGKAAPGYRLAKLVVKLINNVAATIAADRSLGHKLRVLFLPDYGVTVAERLIPAGDVSEQISTAGYEASGTSNMKFMMNGALTIGTRDGATIEMAQAVGEDNLFLFGLSASEVSASRSWYNPQWHYAHDPEIRSTIDLVLNDHFSTSEAGIFSPLRQVLLGTDYYMHLADLRSYLSAHDRVDALYADQPRWARAAVLNIAASGPFSSDRTIREYATDIWNVSPCPVA